MADHIYPVEVQPDFLEKITRAKPVHGLAEFIWNSLDADATSVDVRFDYNELGTMSAIVVTDNGVGMTFAEAPELFRRLGGSWKKPGATTKSEGRFLHGQDGRGRFKAFALGRIAEWDVAYQKGEELWTFKITMNSSNIREVSISGEARAPARRPSGVTLTISELYKDYRGFASDTGVQEFTEIFALYLSDYKTVSITVDGTKIDPVKVIASRHAANLTDITEEGKAYATRVEIIEWHSTTNRALYLCDNTLQRPPLPDRLSANTGSPHYVAAVFEHEIGIRLNDNDRKDVEEYCISEGWVKVPAGKTVDRKGHPVLIKLKGKVEAFYR